jgi:hypothetical protein
MISGLMRDEYFHRTVRMVKERKLPQLGTETDGTLKKCVHFFGKSQRKTAVQVG